ncbi:MAG: TIM barrel protein [Nanoarchaeota archaeon]|nr:TIM barrel protein [Nanoarchaeota archaeon]
MVKGDYTIENIYQGGYSSLKPNYGLSESNVENNFTGFRLPSGQIGAPTKPDTANQIQQVNLLLNQGIVPIEVGALSPDVFDQIPRQHFKEINRMAKLTGAEISMHAPLMEPSGIDQQQGRWSEENRLTTENRFNTIIDRALELRENGRVPITMHSANIAGTEWKMVEENGKRIPMIDKMVVVNRETGQLVPLEPKQKLYPEYSPEKRQEILTKNIKPEIQDELNTLNHSEWNNSLSQVEFNREHAERIISDIHPLIRAKFLKVITNQISPSELNNEEQQQLSRVYSAHEYVKQAELSANALFNKAYKYGTDEDRKFLDEISIEYRKNLGIPKRIDILKDLKKQLSEDELQNYIIKSNDPGNQVAALLSLNKALEHVQPKMYQQVEKFAQEQSSKTFANVALHAYEAVKGDLSKAPKIGIENVYPGIAFSTGQEMADLVEASRKQFVNVATKKGISESTAKKAAEEIIGITFDVGHLNIAKKHGFTNEDLVKEAEKFAKYVKHVHLTDNFGYSDSHLPLGMGNVPVKEHLEMLEKQGVLKNATKIAETSGWPQHFGTSPTIYNLQGMGSAFYSTGMPPYWNQSVGLTQGYFTGYGMMLPQINYETQGAGFSQLPSELGGPRQGAQGSRMSGRPME